ncbi:MAG TPA: histidine kinase [Chloroflexota bacterium]|nr:histidine kinase [Chloroflexota bacterium]
MDHLLAVLNANRALVQFLYGEAFFIVALAVALRANRQSGFRLAGVVWLFAAFALLHAFSEWGEFFIPMQQAYVSTPVVEFLGYLQVILVALSFVLLYQFGALLLARLRPGWGWLSMLTVPLGVAWVISLLIGPSLFPVRGTDLLELALGTARFLLLLPAAALAASALVLQAGDAELALYPRISRSLRWAAFCLVGWAVIAEVLPSVVVLADRTEYLGWDTLLVVVGIPAGLGLAYFITRAMELFGNEQRRQMDAMERRHLVLVERERIAQDLHDGVTQILYSIGMQAQAGSLRASDDRTKQLFDSLSGLTRQGLSDVRSAIDASLPQLGEGRTFQAAIAALPREYAPLSAPTVSLAMTGEPRALPPTVESALYRIAREAFFNACRHGGASQVQVILEFAEAKVTIRIEDDGLGITGNLSNGASASAGHYGLAGMVERLALWHGTFGIRRRPQGGTEVEATIPLPSPPKSPNGQIVVA